MYPTIKRATDFVFSALLLVILSPILLVLMLLIVIDSPGAPIFAQTRVGRYGKPFTVYKLRTMRKDTPRSVAKNELADAQSHITRLGSFLRKMSLDELPQLYNVLRGDMSLIGPRPLVPQEEEVHRERLENGAYNVRPGITGWAQVNGRDEVNSGQKANLDAYYAESLCFALDVKIVVRTVKYVLTGEGIQEGAKEAAEKIEEEGTDAEADDH